LGFPGLHWIRRRQRALAQGVLALFCLVWLQAALLPCAMSMPPEGMSAGGEEHCVYCPQDDLPTDPAGDGAPTTCLYPDGAQVDTRFTLGSSGVALLLPVTFVLAPVASGLAAPAPDIGAPDAIPRPALAVSYCRFLK
jgi:hypothetical protein